MSAGAEGGGGLARRLGVFDAVVIGLGSMVGAGVFAAVGPAAAAAGSGLLIGLALAAVVAYCNATASAQLAALMPESGGSYIYGRERLGGYWGFLAGWGFVTGKTASCAAMALTFGTYAAAGAARWLAAGAVIAVVLVNLAGIERTAGVTRVIVAVVLLSLVCVVVASFAGGHASTARLDLGSASGPYGVLRAASLLFFAFAGYARIATLAEEVTEPERTIPRAIPLALAITLGIYLVVSVAALMALGPGRLAGSHAPLADAVRAGSLDWLAPAVRVGAAVASLGVLLSLMAGVSRTTLAMARKRDLPRPLAAIHARTHVPHRAEIAVALVVVAIVLITGNVGDVIGFSSFTVLTYYGVANASAWTLSKDERRWPRALNAVGLTGCVALAFTLPISTIAQGLGTLAIGTAGWLIRSNLARKTREPGN